MITEEQEAYKTYVENRLYKVIDSFKIYDSHLVSYLLVLKALGILDRVDPKAGIYEANSIFFEAKKVERDVPQLKLANNIFLREIGDSGLRFGHIAAEAFRDLNFENYGDVSVLFEKLEAYIRSKEGKFESTYTLPVELNKLIAGLTPQEEGLSIYNPFAGAATFPIYLKNKCNYIGQELDPHAAAIGNLRLLIHNLGSSYSLQEGDSVNNWLKNDAKYDAVVSSPPFNLRLTKQFEFPLNDQIKYASEFFLQSALQSIKDDGKIIAVLSNSFLYSSGFEKVLRENFIQNNYLETIISLPGGILNNTSIPMCIVVVNKNNPRKDQTFIVDATNLVVFGKRNSKIVDYASILALVINEETTKYSKFVFAEEFKQNNYDLTPARYLIDESGFTNPLVKIGELVTVLRGKKEPVQVGKVVRIRDLKNDRFDFTLNNSELETEITTASFYKLEESAILIATKGNKLKPSEFSYSGEPIWVSNDILALKVDDKRITLPYLVNELYSKFISIQLEAMRKGTGIPSLRMQDVQSLKIEVPPLTSMQESKVLGAKEALWEEKLKEAERVKLEHGLEDRLVEQNRYLRHSLAGPAKNLRGSIENLKKIISEQILPTMPNVMDLTPSKTVARTLGNYLDMISRDINKISDAVSRKTISDEYLINAPLSTINIIDFLYNYISEKKDQVGINYEIEFTIDGIAIQSFNEETDNKNDLYINANEDLLSQLFDNLIENSVQHAFSGNQNNQIRIWLSISLQWLIIDYSNNGTPMPSDIKITDFIRKGATFGKNGGDGYGGWLINEIITKFGGRFDFANANDFPEGTFLGTNFEISLPIVNPE